MSSLSRRACFKCGNVGHYAGEPSRPLAEACAAVGHSGGAYREKARSRPVPASRMHELCDVIVWRARD